MRSLRGRGPLPNAGESMPLGLLGGSGAVSFDLVALKAIQYAPAGASRQTIVEGIGRGIGRVAAHEFAHQILNTGAVHNRDDENSYEYPSPDRAAQYYRRAALDDGPAAPGAEAAMRFTGLTPTLYTRDIRGSVDFYVNALGFEREGPDGGGVAFVRRDEVEIMFAWPNAHMPFERAGADRRALHPLRRRRRGMGEGQGRGARLLPDRGLRLRHARVRRLRQQRLPPPVRPGNRRRVVRLRPPARL